MRLAPEWNEGTKCPRYMYMCVCAGHSENALRDLDPQSIRFLRFSDPDGSSASGASGRLR